MEEEDKKDEICYLPDSSSLDYLTAQKILSNIFSSCGGGSSSDSSTLFPVQHTLFLLRTHPRLITEAFHQRTAMSYFLSQRTDQNVIQELCFMIKEQIPEVAAGNPQPLSQWRYKPFSRQPNYVTDACLYGYEEEGVLELILQEFPHQILQKDPIHNNRLPVEFLIDCILPGRKQANYPNLSMGSRVDNFIVHTVDSLLKVCPTMFHECSCVSEYADELIWGRLHWVSRETADYLFTKFVDRPQGIQSIRCGPSSNLLSVKDARILARALPKTEIFEILPERISEYASRTLLQEMHRISLLRSSLRLVKLGLSIDPEIFVSAAGRGLIQRHLFESIQRCIALKQLKFQMPPIVQAASFRSHHTIGSEDNKQPLQFVGTLISQANRRIQTLELSNVKLGDAPALSLILAQLLQPKTALRCLIFKKLLIVNDRFDSWPHFDIPLHCRIQSIKLDGVDLNTFWTKSLIQQLGDLPRLQKLDICHSGFIPCDPSVTSTLITGLLQKNLLKHLSLKDYFVDMDILCEVLKYNTSLVHLEVTSFDGLNLSPLKALAQALEHHNVTLKRVSIHGYNIGNCPEDVGRKVYYYSLLNRFGRAKLQDPTKASFQNFFEALWYANSRNSMEKNLTNECIDGWRHAAVYGLLRLVPSLWSNGIGNVALRDFPKDYDMIDRLWSDGLLVDEVELDDDDDEDDRHTEMDTRSGGANDNDEKQLKKHDCGAGRSVEMLATPRTDAATTDPEQSEEGSWLFQTSKWKRADVSARCPQRAATGEGKGGKFEEIEGEGNDSSSRRHQDDNSDGDHVTVDGSKKAFAADSLDVSPDLDGSSGTDLDMGDEEGSNNDCAGGAEGLALEEGKRDEEDSDVDENNRGKHSPLAASGDRDAKIEQQKKDKEVNSDTTPNAEESDDDDKNEGNKHKHTSARSATDNEDEAVSDENGVAGPNIGGSYSDEAEPIEEEVEDDDNNSNGSEDEDGGDDDDASWNTIDRERQRELLNLPDGSFEGSCCIQ